MDDATFGGRHRLEHERLTAGANPVGHALGEIAERGLAAAAIALNIDAEADARPQAPAHDHIEQVLERGEGIASPADEHSQVFASNVENGDDHPGTVARRLGRPRLHHRVKAHQIKQRLQGLRCLIHKLCRAAQRRWRAAGIFIRFALIARLSFLRIFDRPEPYPRRFSADAENPGAALAKNLDFDLASVQIELSETSVDCLLDRPSACFQRVHFCHS